MSQQLVLIDTDGYRKLDPRTVEVGRRGIRRARERLEQAARDQRKEKPRAA